ncbi:MAG: polysaccharide deacetylase family protein [Nanoarchaeota archaeon]
MKRLPRRNFFKIAGVTGLSALFGCPVGPTALNLPENGCFITIDDGPVAYDPEHNGNQGHMEDILNYVKQFNGINGTSNRYTFFVEGRYCDPNGDDINKWGFYVCVEAVNDGHEIGNHTQNHYNLRELQKTDPDLVKEEILLTKDIVSQIYAASNRPNDNPNLIRFPYFASISEKEGQRMVWTNVDKQDYTAAGDNLYNMELVDRIKNAYIEAIQKGDIVLTHDLRNTGLSIIPAILEAGFESYAITKKVPLTSSGLINLGNNAPPHLSF